MFGPGDPGDPKPWPRFITFIARKKKKHNGNKNIFFLVGYFFKFGSLKKVVCNFWNLHKSNLFLYFK